MLPDSAFTKVTWLSIFFLLGEWGPFLLIFSAIVLLQKSKYSTYTFYFLFGVVVDAILNVFLKALFREPRPNTDSDLKRLLEKEGIPFCYQYGLTTESFGMPSGHAEMVSFILVFLHFVFHRLPFFMYLLSAVILFNRIYFRFHSVWQVVVGLLIGGCTGYLFYFLGRRQLMGSLRERADDFYMFSFSF